MSIEKLLALGSVATAFIAGSVAQAQSTVIFDSFETVWGSHIVGLPVGSEDNWMMAQNFRTGAENWTLESVTLALSLFPQTPRNGGFTVRLYSDSGSGPGIQLLTLSGNDNPDSGLNSYTGAFDLIPNTTYWIRAENVSPLASAYSWDITYRPATVGSTSGMGYSPDGGNTWSLWNGDRALMRVMANPTVVPEPSVTALFGVGGAALLMFRRKSET